MNEATRKLKNKLADLPIETLAYEGKGLATRLSPGDVKQIAKLLKDMGYKREVGFRYEDVLNRDLEEIDIE